MKFFKTISVAVAGTIMLLAASAASATTITMSDVFGNRLIGVSETAVENEVSTPRFLSAISFDTNGTLFGVNGLNNDLVTVDLATGVQSTIATLPSLSFSVNSMDFASDGTLYAAFGGALSTIDTTTAVLTTIGNFGPQVGSLVSLAVAADDTIYILENSGNLFTVDAATGASTLVGDTGRLNADGIDFDENGRLLGVLGASVFEINVSDASTTTLNFAAPDGFTDIRDITIDASATPVPVPASLPLLAAGMTVVLMLRRRRT